MLPKYLALLLLLSGPGWGWLSGVRERNAALAQAQAAYRRGDAAGAAANYQRALAAAGPSSRAATDPRLLLNLAHALAQAGQATAARATYGQLLSAGQVPVALGSVARQQLAVLAAGQKQYAPALSLLRQALQLNPANAGARYDYEVLREFLARQPAAEPTIPPPAGPANPRPRLPTPPSPANAAQPPASAAPRSGARPGADRPGQANDAEQPGPPPTTSLPPPAAGNGRPNPMRPDPAPGARARGSFRPGAGPPRPLPTGPATGAERGLHADATSAAGAAGGLLGTETATAADQQLQTQRERLRQLNLTPAQAQQLLEALRAQEQQYLQQRPRPPGRRARPGEPTW